MIKINKHIQDLKPSATLAINQQVKKLRNEGNEVYHFGFGQSPFPIYEDVVKALKAQAHNNHYLETTGLEKLRVQITKFLSKYQGVHADPKYTYIGPGSKELLFQTILLLEGVFLIPKGSWVSYLPQIRSKNGAYAILDTDFVNDFKLMPVTLENYCQEHQGIQKTLILNSPNNPTGAVYTDAELMALAIVCKKYGIIVLSDEIYSQINFKTPHSPSMAEHYPKRTIVFGGLSKVFSAGGYRLGFMVLPKDLYALHTAYRSLFSETFSAVASPIQYAAIEAYRYSDYLQAYVSRTSTILKGVSAYIYEKLSETAIEVTYSEGAFYMMIGFNHYKNQMESLGIYSSEMLSTHLLEHYKVALLPGTDFYFEEKDLFFRLAFVDFNGEHVLEAYKKDDVVIDKDFIKTHCPNIYGGVKAIIDFVSEL